MPYHYGISDHNLQIDDSSISLSMGSLNFDFVEANGRKVIIFTDFDNTTFDPLNDYPFPEISFNFAVPDFKKIKFEYSIISYSDIEETEIMHNISKPYQLKNIQSKVEFIDLGYQRGINIAHLKIMPIEYFPLEDKFKIIDSISINIQFNDSFTNSKFELYPTDITFFGSIDNFEHLSPIIQVQKIAKLDGNKILSMDNWYDSNVKYVKISTNKDAFVVVPLTDIISINNELSGKDSKYLHMLFEGEEYPFILNDSDGILTNDDEIVFLGKIAHGDTTWFDTYTQYENFFIYYDETSIGLRLNRFDNSANPAKVISKGQISQHFEIDTKYEWGDDIAKSTTAFNEGWFWKVLSPGSSGFNERYPKFTEMIPMDPIGDVTLKLNYKNLIYASSPNIKPHDSVYFDINGLRIFETAHNDYINTFVEANSINANFISGLNQVELRPEKIGTLAQGYIMVDFIKVEGTVNSSVFDGMIEIMIPEQDESAELQIYGFGSNNVHVLETINNEYIKPETVRGNTIRIGGINSEKSIVSLMINDSSFTSFTQGFHLLSIDTERSFRYLSTKDHQEVDQFLDNLNEGDVLSVVINSHDVVPSYLISAFQNLGAQKILAYEDGYVWTFAALIGEQYIVENLEESKSSISTFFPTINGASYRISMNINAGREYNFIANDSDAFSDFSINAVSESNLRSTDIQADVIYLSHPNFIEAAERLADYRRNNSNLNIEVISTDDVYKEFGYGKKSPYPIKEFLRYTQQNWQKPAPAYLGIWGDASWDNRRIRDKSISVDFVPSYGNPTSDYWYGLMNNDLDELPQIKVGRIPAKSLEEAQNYVDKAIEYETIPLQPWFNKFLLLSGGINDDEREDFYSFSLGFADIILSDTLCGDTITVQKKDPVVGGETEAGSIRKAINEGVGWINFFGHASSGVFDMDGWHVSKLHNNSRYPFFSAVSCNTGAFAEPDRLESRNESYVIAKDIGFINALGSSGTGYTDVGNLMYFWMLKSIARTDIAHRRAGDILYYAKQRLFVLSGARRDAYLYQFNVLGDPLVSLRLGVDTDLFINKNETTISKLDGGKIFNENDDQVIIETMFHNNGYRTYDNTRIRLIHKYFDISDTTWYNYSDVCGDDHFISQINIKGMPGIHTVSIMLDSDSLLSDIDYSNNYFISDFEVFKTGLLRVDPFDYWDVSANNPRFRYINPFSFSKDNYVYEFRITGSPDSESDILHKSVADEIRDNKINIDYIPEFSFTTGKQYWIHARLKNLSQGNLSSYWITTPINITDTYKADLVTWKQFTSEQFSTNHIDKMVISDDKLKLGHIDKVFKIVAVNGILNDTIDIKRWINIEVGNDVFVDSEYERGFNVVVLSPRNEGHQPIKRRFDTWADTHSTENLVRFLRDTVNAEDYVLIGTCDQSFRAATELVKPGSVGELDSLKAILKEYGSQYADSLTDNWSFAMVGKRGAQSGEFPEMVMEWDSAMVTGNLRFKDMEGHTSFKVGPAKNWKKYLVDVELDEGSEILINLYDDQEVPELIAAFDNIESSLDDVIDKDIKYINAELVLKRNDISSDPKISSINFEFEARPEIALNPDLSRFSDDIYLRAVDAELIININNLSFRSSTDSLDIETRIQRGDDVESLFIEQDTIESDTYFDKKVMLKTNILEAQNNIDYILNYNGLSRELYDFNNSGTTVLFIREDSTRPIIVLKADGEIVNNFDFIGIRPFIEVELYDNSNLSITDPENIEIRINSKFQNEFNTDNYKFESFNDDTDLKLRVSFIPDSLNKGSSPDRVSQITGDNLFKINASDNSGNSDTVKIYANVSINNFIINDMVYPNPIGNSPIIKFNYVAQSNEGYVRCFIYNSIGQIVNSLEIDPRIGENIIRWNAKDEQGSSVPAGVYYYKLVYMGRLYAEPKIGKMIKI